MQLKPDSDYNIMPSSVGPNTFGEENLVFGYDLGDTVNSYKGEPTVNSVPGTYGFSTYAYVSGPVDTLVLNEKNKLITAKRYTITQAINVARAAIFPVGLTTGVSFTFSFKWKYKGSTTASPSVSISAQKGSPEGSGNNNSFTSQTGNTVFIGNGWYLSTYTFIFSSVPTGKCMLTFGIVTGGTATFVGETFDVYEAQFETKSHKTQFSNGTRSSTQGLIDLKGTSTIDLANVSFDSNAQMTFDGTDDRLVVPHTAILDIQNSITVETVVIYQGQGGGGQPYSVITYKGYPWTWLLEDQNGIFNFRISTSSNSDSNISSGISHGLGSFHHVVGTYDGVNQVIYVNGVLRNTKTLTGTINTSGNTVRIGSYTDASYVHNGRIPVVKIYNRALTASEIKSNFNAIKGRFNI